MWLIDNWYILVGILALCSFVVYCIYTFFGLPTTKQKEQIKEWLIWACIEAEKSLQSETGQLKLRQVYNMFCSVPAFTWIAKVIPFKMFSSWVSESLVEVKKMLVSNNTLAKYVYGENAEVEVAKIQTQLKEVT